MDTTKKPNDIGFFEKMKFMIPRWVARLDYGLLIVIPCMDRHVIKTCSMLKYKITYNAGIFNTLKI